MEVIHQLRDRNYYFPNWEVNTIFLGTFNPICVQNIDYYYRRKYNGFWKIIKHYDQENDFNFDDFNQLRSFMVSKKFGCIDVIKKVIFPDNQMEIICGKGYGDNKLFKVTNYYREYLIDELKEFIIRNRITQIFSTWGKRNSPKEFRILKSEFISFCEIHNVNFINLPSPSGRVYRGNRIESINNEWWRHLNPIFLR